MVLEDKYCNFKRQFHQLLNIRQAQHWEIVPRCTYTPNKSVLQQNFTVIAALLCIAKCTLKIPVNLLASLLFPIPQQKINIFRGYMAWFRYYFLARTMTQGLLADCQIQDLQDMAELLIFSVARHSFLWKKERTKVTEQFEHYATLIK